MSYCIAFSVDGCRDVTRRYVRDPIGHGLPRDNCPEQVLWHIIRDIAGLRRKHCNKDELLRLGAEDKLEEQEFQDLTIEALAYKVSQLHWIPGDNEWNGGARREGKNAESRADTLPARVEESQARSRFEGPL